MEPIAPSPSKYRRKPKEDMFKSADWINLQKTIDRRDAGEKIKGRARQHGPYLFATELLPSRWKRSYDR
jgi:hypothetical protein